MRPVTCSQDVLYGSTGEQSLDLRNVLRAGDKEKQRKLIPLVHTDTNRASQPVSMSGLGIHWYRSDWMMAA